MYYVEAAYNCLTFPTKRVEIVCIKYDTEGV